RESLFQRGRIDEGLERRPRLAPGLRNVVELVAMEVESADERAHGAVARIKRDERRFGLGQLQDLPALLVVALHADHRAAADAALRRGLFLEPARGELEPLARDR